MAFCANLEEVQEIRNEELLEFVLDMNSDDAGTVSGEVVTLPVSVTDVMTPAGDSVIGTAVVSVRQVSDNSAKGKVTVSS